MGDTGLEPVTPSLSTGWLGLQLLMTLSVLWVGSALIRPFSALRGAFRVPRRKWAERALPHVQALSRHWGRCLSRQTGPLRSGGFQTLRRHMRSGLRSHGRSGIGSAGLAGRELVAGVAGVDQTSHESAAAYRERREHVQALIAAHLGCRGRPVVRCVFGESPDHHEYEIQVDTTANGETPPGPSRGPGAC